MTEPMTPKTSQPTQPGEADRQPLTASRVMLVTGMSGAGRSSALKALEDIGYEAVDNLPLALLRNMVVPEAATEAATEAVERPLAIGLDIRTRGFGVEALLHEVERLQAHPELEVVLLFLDCDDEILRRRYTETRRRHPMMPDRPVQDGIRLERETLQPLRQRADVVIDTSGRVIRDLKRQIAELFALERSLGLSIFVTSFSYRRGLPREADLVFDVRFLDNPYYQTALRPLTGQDEAVGRFIESDRDFRQFFASLTQLLQPLLPRYEAEGKSYLTIAIGCTGGRHRSVFIAERAAQWLPQQGRRVSLSHRDLENHRFS